MNRKRFKKDLGEHGNREIQYIQSNKKQKTAGTEQKARLKSLEKNLNKNLNTFFSSFFDQLTLWCPLPGHQTGLRDFPITFCELGQSSLYLKLSLRLYFLEAIYR